MRNLNMSQKKESVFSVELDSLRLDEESILKRAAISLGTDDKTGLETTRQTLYGLRLQQVELEVKNEELRHAQRIMDAERVWYFGLYDLAPVGYCVISATGVILESNLTTAVLLGVKRSELADSQFVRYILGEDHDKFNSYAKKLIETGEPQEIELRMVRQDQTVFWAKLTATLVQIDHSAAQCRVIISDISGRKQAEETHRLSEECFYGLARE